jgi:hypothetical protein
MAEKFSFFSDSNKGSVEETREKLENLEQTLSPATVERYYSDEDWGDDYVDVPTKTITFYEPAVTQETQFFPTQKEYSDKLTKATEEKLRNLETRLSESVKEIDEIQTTTISFDNIKKDTTFFPMKQDYDTTTISDVSTKLANLEQRIEESKTQ